MAGDRILDGLNDAQREAVTHDAGPLLIVAGAGTGKTTGITPRIAWLSGARPARPPEGPPPPVRVADGAAPPSPRGDPRPPVHPQGRRRDGGARRSARPLRLRRRRDR